MPSTQPAFAGLLAPQAKPVVDAYVDPPVGWLEDPLRSSKQHVHAVWVSPSRDTAYGVVLMYLPLPVGPDIVLWAFLNHLKEKDHQAELLSKTPAPDLPGLRFVTESGQYVLRVNLVVHGWRAWAVYVGTRRGKPANARELELGEQARDHTQVGLPAEAASAQ